MKFYKTDVWGFEHAVRGMRNPLESRHKSDSGQCCQIRCEDCAGPVCEETIFDYNQLSFVIGKNDLKLMQKLIRAGSEHRKFMRQIMVSVDITAPLYWFKEFDTYKVGTAANSTSTMHKLASKIITMDCFEMGDFQNVYTNGTATCRSCWDIILFACEGLRQKYNETKDARYWKELIRILPESWLQTRTVTLNYENIYNMIRQRRSHKLTEWSVDFMAWASRLPYAEELLLFGLDMNKG